MDQAAKVEIYGSFFLGDVEFALPVSRIQEVVNPPTEFSPLPLAPKFLLGVFNLRGTIIPVVDLKNILELATSDFPAANKKIAIVDHQGVKIGLLFDRTGEIFRNQVDEKSDFEYSGPDSDAKRNVVSGAIKLDQGKRIVQVLDVFALIKLENVPHAALQNRAQEARRKQGRRQQCISFLLGGSRCAFGIDAIHEIIMVPKLKESALASKICIGLLELRGDVIPVIDFAHLLRYSRPAATDGKTDTTEERRILIMKINDNKFGFLIDSVESIVTYYGEELLPLPLLNQDKVSMFLGCLSKPGLGDIILLSHEQILSREEIHEITRGHGAIYPSDHSSESDKRKKKGLRKTYISFKVQNLAALGIEEVREIIDLPPQLIAPPGLPSSVKGMLNLRGQLVTILDARTLYGMAPSDSLSPKILVFERNGSCYGIVVDSVENIISFSEEEKIKLPQMLHKTPGTNGLSSDVKFAVQVDVEGQASTLLVIDLDPLIARVHPAAS